MIHVGTTAWAIISEGSRPQDKMFNLNMLLSMTWETSCFDPRDRIFALLSLLSPRESELWVITPHYENSTQTLFEELCSVFQNPKLDVARGGDKLEDWKRKLCHLLLL